MPGTVANDMRERIGLIVGPLFFITMLLLAPPNGMSETAWRAAALAVLMATWWITEAIPISATALLPLLLLPILGITTMEQASSPYANPVVYLFLGGFLIALALESCGLHKRLAITILIIVGTRPANLIFGFMAATAFLSMWVSNTATVVMMLPIATSVTALSAENRNFNLALVLGVAYASSIGGLGTLIGTPPNALLAGYMAETHNVQISFVDWMLLGVPLVIVSLPVAWVLLTKILFKVGDEPIAGGAEMLRSEKFTLGRMSRAEWIVGTITTLTAVAWVTRPLFEQWASAVTDTTIAIAGALLLFIVPITWRPLRVPLIWKDAERLPWAVLLLFGGGLSLAAGIERSGLAAWFGDALGGLAGLPVFAVILIVTALIIFLGELTSNTATAAAFLPIAGALAIGIGVDPIMIAVPTALAASCSFMLPVGTPPNAIVYATGHVTIQQMAKAGIWLNVFFMLLIPVVTYLLVVKIFGL